MIKAADHGKRVQSQAGAKNSIVVIPDANLEWTVPALLTSLFGYAEERCLAGVVLLPERGFCEPLKERFIEAAARFKLGDPFDEATQMGPTQMGPTQMGPLTSRRHKERV